ncbi:MAG: VPLPA-CTERM sorting domain-containing protein [Gammaproteobacteria bacterium]
MNFKRLLIGLALAVCGSANAATVFMTTDGNVNFFNINLAAGSTLAMFDDNDDVTFVNDLIIPLPSAVDIVADGLGDFTATSKAPPNNSITLTTNPWYVLAVSNDGGASWMGDSFAACDSISQSCTVSFADGSVLSVDAAVVPVPAAVWLFGSGLLGLVGIARRKQAA